MGIEDSVVTVDHPHVLVYYTRYLVVIVGSSLSLQMFLRRTASVPSPNTR